MQIKALRTEAAFLRKTLDSLREERRQARETVSRQFTEIQNLRAAQARPERYFGRCDGESSRRLAEQESARCNEISFEGSESSRHWALDFPLHEVWIFQPRPQMLDLICSIGPEKRAKPPAAAWQARSAMIEAQLQSQPDVSSQRLLKIQNQLRIRAAELLC